MEGDWRVVDEIQAFAFDTLIRNAGWHFMWMQGPTARRGFGRTPQDATRHATLRALAGLPRRFNAAEFDSVDVRSYPGFSIATVTMQPRHIQEHAILETPDNSHRLAHSAS